MAPVAALAAAISLSPTVASTAPAQAVENNQPFPATQAVPVPELATATTNTVREPDGSFTLTAYAQPVNYQDPHGDWQPIDNTLVDAPGETYDVQNTANSFIAKIPKDPEATPIKVIDGGQWVTMQMDGIANTPAAVVEDTATFAEAAETDGVQYQVTNTGLKESILLDAAPIEPVRYTYTLDTSPGLTPTLLENGSVAFRDVDGHTVFDIPAGLMYDSADEAATSTHITYTLNHKAGQWTLAVYPEAAWLSDPARVYPVVIDPTLNGQPDVHDCNLRSAVPDNTACGDQTTYLKAGRSDASHKYRGVLDFDVSSIPQTAAVSYATLHLYLDEKQTLDATQSADYGVYPTSKSFNGRATWNSSGANGAWTGGSPGSFAYSTKTMKGDTPGDKPFYNLDGLVQAWVLDPTRNTGLVVKQVDETTNNILGFYSNASTNAQTKRPFMDITYRLRPTISIEPAVGTSLGDVIPTIATATGPVDLVMQTSVGDSWFTIGTRVTSTSDVQGQLQHLYQDSLNDADVAASAGPALPAFGTELTSTSLNVVQMTITPADKTRFTTFTQTNPFDLATLANDNEVSASIDDADGASDPDDASGGLSADPDYSAFPMKADGSVPNSAEQGAACDRDGWFSPRSNSIKAYQYYDQLSDQTRGFIKMKFSWTIPHLLNLRCGRDNVTYEHDFKTNNYDDKHIFEYDSIWDWSSTMPRAYKDTTFEDSANEYYFTVGSSDATKIISKDTPYVIKMWTMGGNTSVDKAALYGQRGVRVPVGCHSTWCIFSQGKSNKIIKAWKIDLPKNAPSGGGTTT